MKNEFDLFINGKYCRINKVATKNPGFFQDGFFQDGYVEIMEYDNFFWIVVSDHNNWMKTSPVVSVVDKTETSITFETENSTYKLELI